MSNAGQSPVSRATDILVDETRSPDDASETAWDYDDVWAEYERILGALADEIAADVPQDEALDGPAWCDEHDVPVSMFAHAVEQSGYRFDWATTPVYPWVPGGSDSEE